MLPMLPADMLSAVCGVQLRWAHRLEVYVPKKVTNRTADGRCEHRVAVAILGSIRASRAPS